MLELVSVNPTGMFSYGPSKDVDLRNKGLVNLVGVNQDKQGCSNGAGKTSLFNAICELLFRQNPTGAKNDEIINNSWDRGFCGRISFKSWEQVPCRVTYCRKWKEVYYEVDNDTETSYTGTSLYFDKFLEGKWRNQCGASMADTSASIVSAIGLSYAQFVSISYMSHRVGSVFLRGSNKERMDLMSGIAGIEEWDRVLDNSRSSRRDLLSSVQDTERKVAFEEGQISALNNQLEGLNRVDWGKQQEEYTVNYAAFKELLTTFNVSLSVKQGELEVLQAQKGALVDGNKLELLHAELSDKEAACSTLGSDFRPPEITADDAYQALLAAKNTKSHELAGLQATVRVVKSGSDVLLSSDQCPTCGAKISKTKKDKYLKSVADAEKAVVAVSVEIEDIGRQMTQFEAISMEARLKLEGEKAQKLGVLQEEIEGKKKEINDLYYEQRKIDPQIQQCNSDISELQQKVSSTEGSIRSLSQYMAQCDENLEKIDVVMGQLSQAGASLLAVNQEVERLSGEVVIVDWVISNVPYIKLHKVSVTMQELSTLANQYLSGMGESIRVEISAFDEKKGKKGAADLKDMLKGEIKVVIRDGLKEIPPKLYSEGETGTISNALVLALNDLAKSLGYGCNVVLLDEIFAFIDGANSQKLAQSIEAPAVGTTFITDNSGNVSNFINFSETWVALKENGITTMEVE